MLVSDSVVFEEALLCRFGHQLRTDGAACIGHGRRALDDVERLPRVTPGKVEQRGEALSGEADAAGQAALVRERSRDDLAQVLL